MTVASGGHAERLDQTFLSFSRNPGLHLHAFIIGTELPKKRLSEITYHLKEPDPAFGDPMRDLYYRRWLFVDDLSEDYVCVVDNSDVLCLQNLPAFDRLLQGRAIAGCSEHPASRYIAGQGFTTNYINCGVLFFDRAGSRAIREEVVARGRARFRSVEDQLTFNEVVQTCHYDELALLPCQYNFRAHYRFHEPKWPTVETLDGVKIYHNAASMAEARKTGSFAALAALPEFVADQKPLTKFQKILRKVLLRRERHWVR